VLILSWEYPPVIEGGLARHVRKLAEALVRQGVLVDVLTRGTERSQNGLSGADELDGLTIHRVREPSWPRDLDRFVAWVERMNEDMLAAGEALAQDSSYDLIHGHDWLVAQASAGLADRLRVP
jgi:glycogen(starch) synthase